MEYYTLGYCCNIFTQEIIVTLILINLKILLYANSDVCHIFVSKNVFFYSLLHSIADIFCVSRQNKKLIIKIIGVTLNTTQIEQLHKLNSFYSWEFNSNTNKSYFHVNLVNCKIFSEHIHHLDTTIWLLFDCLIVIMFSSENFH